MGLLNLFLILTKAQAAHSLPLQKMSRFIQELYIFSWVISTLQYHHPLPQQAVESLRVEFSLRCHPALMFDNETLRRGNSALSVLINDVQMCRQQQNVSWAPWPTGTKCPLASKNVLPSRRGRLDAKGAPGVVPGLLCAFNRAWELSRKKQINAQIYAGELSNNFPTWMITLQGLGMPGFAACVWPLCKKCIYGAK